MMKAITRQSSARRPDHTGFTVIELLVVLAAMALLLALATPRYFQHVDQAKELALRHDLRELRMAIDRYHGDRAQWPASLDELVTHRYLREVPPDPMTGLRDSWVTLSASTQGAGAAGIADVRSGAPGLAQDGTAYASW